jgi:dTDP-4-dehydrorhamnose reductase
MTRWLVTGAGGMLARDLLEVLDGDDVVGLTRAELDITDRDAVAAAVAGRDVVVNAAAWTDVDGAELAEDEATLVNGLGPRLLAEACRDASARLVHVSTDYVFDGTSTTPYDEDHPIEPRSAYGRSKALGEDAVRSVLPDSSYVVRSAWLYGEHGGNFVRAMIGLERQRDTVEVVDDQRGQPTWSLDLALQIAALVRSGSPAGIYHGTSSGETTWCGLARAVFEELGADPERVRPTTTERFQRPAPRPAYSVLGHGGWTRAGLAPIRDWREALAQAFPRVRSSA